MVTSDVAVSNLNSLGPSDVLVLNFKCLGLVLVVDPKSLACDLQIPLEFQKFCS